MFTAILGLPIIGQLVTGVINGFLGAYKAKLASDTSMEATAADLAKKELDVQGREIAAIQAIRVAEIGHPWEPDKIAAYITFAYYGKIVFFDKILGAWTGWTTDPLTGQAAVWATLIMSYYFAKRGAENVTTIMQRGKK